MERSATVGAVVPRREYSEDRDVARFWRELVPRREPVRWRGFLPAILVALVLSVPWYWTAGATPPVLYGLPSWVWATLACSLVVSGVTAYAALRHWDDDD